MNYKVSQIKLSAEVAQQKIMTWCAYQERSQHETRNKLFEYGLSSEETEAIISNLISENFLSEERFAVAFASGKFRIKHWGKNKIKIELKKHRVSEYCLNKALKLIDMVEYQIVIGKVIEKRRKLFKGSDKTKEFYNVLNYLISRGFESDLVRENLGKLRNEND
ncbi:regulatory protein RecX [Aurantibacillus circumpalustris]|uniref:regulatory protein RecX n=1 Tax=Aurantibacillus circumpalustris TaxID=3036359 RepID=UPI00295AC474|nr:regulatory protein RecX [Aurantibacillus circumpalustris]